MSFLRKILFDQTSRQGRIFEIFIQSLIIISVLNFSIQTIPDLPLKVIYLLDLVEFISVVIFSIEYILRICFSKSSIKFMFSFFGVIDLLAILPFYLSLGIDLRSIRAIRVFRIFRVLKLLRYSKAIDRLKMAFFEVKNELIIFSVACLFFLYFSAVGVYFFENEVQPENFKSIFHSMWWAVATLTTVGYGDVYPVTLGGRIFTSLVIFLGLGLIAIPTGLIASSFGKAFNKDDE